MTTPPSFTFSAVDPNAAGALLLYATLIDHDIDKGKLPRHWAERADEARDAARAMLEWRKANPTWESR